MKERAIVILVLVGMLAACAPAQRSVPTTPTQSAGTVHEAFAIYLLAGNVTVEQAFRSRLEALPLQAQPILAEADLLGYDPQTCTMQMRAEAAQRIKLLRVPVSGIPFVVTVGERRIYAGAFWTSLSSASFDEGVVIDALRMGEDNTLRFQLGYPESPEMFRGQDLRNDPRILQSLGEAGITKMPTDLSAYYGEKPPAAVLSVEGQEQAAGIGTFTWIVEKKGDVI